ncbi:MAG: hypothetical protein ABI555_01515 [Chloroflexota bacterium]
MSFLDRAKQAAAQAADQTRQAAESARHAATDGTERAQAILRDPSSAEKARQAVARARRGVATAIDRIDPTVLADVVIKATALQERANTSLKSKGSPYRISEVSIGAAIPPSVTFTIARTDDPEIDLIPDGTMASVELVSDGATGTINALDGTIVDLSGLEEDQEQ